MTCSGSLFHTNSHWPAQSSTSCCYRRTTRKSDSACSPDIEIGEMSPLRFTYRGICVTSLFETSTAACLQILLPVTRCHIRKPRSASVCVTALLDRGESIRLKDSLESAPLQNMSRAPFAPRPRPVFLTQNLSNAIFIHLSASFLIFTGGGGLSSTGFRMRGRGGIAMTMQVTQIIDVRNRSCHMVMITVSLAIWAFLHPTGLPR